MGGDGSPVLPRSQWLYGAGLHLYPECSGSETYSLGVAVSQDDPLVVQYLALRLESLWILRCTTDVRDAHKPSPRSLGNGLGLLPGCSQHACSVWMGTPAEHHIAEYHGDCRVASRLQEMLPAHAGVDHRMGPSLGKLLCSQIQDHVGRPMRSFQGVVKIGGHSPQSPPQETKSFVGECTSTV